MERPSGNGHIKRMKSGQVTQVNEYLSAVMDIIPDKNFQKKKVILNNYKILLHNQSINRKKK